MASGLAVRGALDDERWQKWCEKSSAAGGDVVVY